MSDQFHQLVETVEKASVSNDWQGAKSQLPGTKVPGL